MEDGSEVKKLEGHANSLECVGFYEDDEVIISGAQGGQVILWSLEFCKILIKIETKCQKIN